MKQKIPYRTITESTGYLTTQSKCELCNRKFKVGERINWVILKIEKKKETMNRLVFGIVHLHCPIKKVKTK